ncbi:DUF3566 domain-containing protein [Streptomyces sp. NPDC100445]|uniref:DUF3566 domain-containing protein n=1 Tax=Streptomyces sp. NPDC100445 TaxID=3366102 RepID=UPI003815B3DA
MLTSFLFLTGLGVVVITTMTVAWVLVEVLAPDTLPSLGSVLTIALGIATMEVVLGTALATLCTFLYNLSAQYNGGIEVTLTADLTTPTPAYARALVLMTRARARVGRYARGHMPPWLRRAVRHLPKR